MAQSEGLSPERRSDNAVLLVTIGAAVMGAAWLFGAGGLVALLLSGNVTGLVAAAAAQIVAALGFAAGMVLFAAGVVWVVIRVIVDQASSREERRYSKDVER